MRSVIKAGINEYLRDEILRLCRSFVRIERARAVGLGLGAGALLTSFCGFHCFLRLR